MNFFVIFGYFLVSTFAANQDFTGDSIQFTGLPERQLDREESDNFEDLHESTTVPFRTGAVDSIKVDTSATRFDEKYMEDRWVLSKVAEGVFLGCIFDGHGGSFLMADTLRLEFPQFLKDQLIENGITEDMLAESWSEKLTQEIQEVVTSAFVDFDAITGERFGHVDTTGGSTAGCILFTDKDAFFANIGDSPIELYEKPAGSDESYTLVYTSEELTHCLKCRKVRENIEDDDHLRNFLFPQRRKMDHWRLGNERAPQDPKIARDRNSAGLNLAKSIGDYRYKMPRLEERGIMKSIVGNEADCHHIKLESNKQYTILLCSDGFSDLNAVFKKTKQYHEFQVPIVEAINEQENPARYILETLKGNYRKIIDSQATKKGLDPATQRAVWDNTVVMSIKFNSASAEQTSGAGEDVEENGEESEEPEEV